MQITKQQTAASITSLLIPMQAQALLVPTVAVAEMVPYSPPEAVAGAPEWLLGSISWRNLQVPLLAYEVFNGEPAPQAGEASRIVVFNNTGVSEALPFIAVQTAGIPRLVRIEEGDLQRLAVGDAGSVTRMLVGFEGSSLVIPELSELEQRYLAWSNGG